MDGRDLVRLRRRPRMHAEILFSQEDEVLTWAEATLRAPEATLERLVAR